jgi:hypothetical protein
MSSSSSSGSKDVTIDGRVLLNPILYPGKNNQWWKSLKTELGSKYFDVIKYLDSGEEPFYVKYDFREYYDGLITDSKNESLDKWERKAKGKLLESKYAEWDMKKEKYNTEWRDLYLRMVKSISKESLALCSRHVQESQDADSEKDPQKLLSLIVVSHSAKQSKPTKLEQDAAVEYLKKIKQVGGYENTKGSNIKWRNLDKHYESFKEQVTTCEQIECGITNDDLIRIFLASIDTELCQDSAVKHQGYDPTDPRYPADYTSVYRLAQQWNITGESVLRQARGGDEKMEAIKVSRQGSSAKANAALGGKVQMKGNKKAEEQPSSTKPKHDCVFCKKSHPGDCYTYKAFISDPKHKAVVDEFFKKRKIDYDKQQQQPRKQANVGKLSKNQKAKKKKLLKQLRALEQDEDNCVEESSNVSGFAIKAGTDQAIGYRIRSGTSRYDRLCEDGIDLDLVSVPSDSEDTA